jgi:hypothetical protein
MRGMNWYLASGSVLLLFLAHVVRCIRWRYLFPAHYLTRRLNLLSGLSIGYVVNALLPYRFGEFVRIFYVSERDHIRFAYVAATVAAERLSDLIAVALVATTLTGMGYATGSRWLKGVLIMAVASLILYGLAKAVACSVRVRRGLWHITSIFNDKIHLGISDFFWSFSLLVNKGLMCRRQFINLTLLMWALYISSYVMFGASVNVSLSEVMYLLFGKPLTSMGELLLNGGNLAQGMHLLMFTSMPVLGVIAYSLVRDRTALARILSSGRRFSGAASLDHFISPTSDRFKDYHQYQYFLTSLFSNDERLVTDFGLTAIEDGIIHKLFVGGSDAITALCEVSNHFMIRKFALGAAAGKLREQGRWLRAHRLELPLVEIVDERGDKSSYRYDMPYFPNASDFYDIIHSAPIEQSYAILDNIIDAVNSLHRRTQHAEASTEAIQAYLTTKAKNNAKIVLHFAQSILEDRTYYINHNKFDLSIWDYLLDGAWLTRQIRDRRTAVIHGDLTVENIIVHPSGKAGWYLIDPNPENIFESPLIDWAKMLQSLHLGYEALNRGVPATIKDNEIFISAPKSLAYQKLFEYFLAAITERTGSDIISEIYFHELVNYLRLTPYKIRRNPTSGLIFFACTSLILGEYMERHAR